MKQNELFTLSLCNQQSELRPRQNATAGMALGRGGGVQRTKYSSQGLSVNKIKAFREGIYFWKVIYINVSRCDIDI
jgi:hypothetical protein